MGLLRPAHSTVLLDRNSFCPRGTYSLVEKASLVCMKSLVNSQERNVRKTRQTRQTQAGENDL